MRQLYRSSLPSPESLKLKIITEDVELYKQFEQLKNIGCDEIQG